MTRRKDKVLVYHLFKFYLNIFLGGLFNKQVLEGTNENNSDSINIVNAREHCSPGKVHLK